MATRKKETVKARKSEGFVEFLPRFVDPAGTNAGISCRVSSVQNAW